MWTFNEGQNVGEFTEADYGKVFTYRKTTELDYNPYGLPHLIDVLDGTRFGTVKKTVVYICVDEDADGQPVFEKWYIKKHKIYNES